MTSAPPGVRPLTRSLEPLGGESLAGYLLRLSCRLHVSPLQLARLAGCADPGSGVIMRRRMLDLDVPRFAEMTRLSEDEASSLTMTSWAGRYPPVTRTEVKDGPPFILDKWLLAVTPRFCPDCLAGDGSPVQQQYGGPWKKTWQLPVSFACPEHNRFLRQACPQQHPAGPALGMLIGFPAGTALHPAQCRLPRQPGKKGPNRPSCGTRLDQGDDRLPDPSDAVLSAQQRILALLDPAEHPARDASWAFADLRVASALLCMSWPLGRDLADAATAAAIDDHVARGISGLYPKALDRQPAGALAAAGLLTAAFTILDSPDLADTIARHAEVRRPSRPSRSSWTALIDRHYSDCSPTMRDAAAPTTRAYRKSAGPHSTKAPSRTGTYQPEHIPALLDQQWYDQHLADLGYKGATTMRRAGSVLLVQWTSGRSLGDAARYLGIPTGPSRQHSFGPDLARWLRDHGSEEFTAALREIADQLDHADSLVNYRHRRQVMREWCLDLETWQDITSRLQPVPGVQPILDDRKRQEASAFTWAHVTQGEPRYAPRPIEAGQAEHVRREWFTRRANLWHKLARPGRLVHYAELRKLLLEHAGRLARDIDYNAPPVLRRSW